MLPAGHVELAEQDEGLSYLAGWVRLPAGLPAEAVVHLRLRFEDGAPIDYALRRLVPRPDLPANADQQAGAGFHLLLPRLAAWKWATAALLLGEEEQPVLPTPIRPSPLRPRGHLGQITRHGLGGWVLDRPDRPPLLWVEGEEPVPVELSVERPDLPFEDGDDNSRFGFQLSLEALGRMLRCAKPGLALLDGRPRGVTLTAGGVEIGHTELKLRRDMDGSLEHAASGELRGWASEVDPGPESPAVDIVLDGTRWTTLNAATPRGDLTAAGIGTRVPGGAFRAELPARHPGEGGTLRVALRPAHGIGELKGSCDVSLPPWRPDRGGLRDLLSANGPPAVAIIVPIHNAAEDLARCIESVVAHTTGRARLLLLDDASTEPAIETVLRRWEDRPGIEVHRNERNLGFTGTANHGCALAGRDDIVLLNSDTVVGPGWLDGLRLAALSSPSVGTVTAISNNAGAFSVPEFDADNNLPPHWTAADLARLARQVALGLWPSVPTGNGFCMYVRRACLDAVGQFDVAAFPRGYGEENDFCMRALRAGFEHLLDDRTLVWHRRSASFGESRQGHIAAGKAVLATRYPEYPKLVSMFRNDQALQTIRWRMRRALAIAPAAGVPRPRVLFVLSTRTGGTPQTNRDLMEALADRYEAWTLHSDGKELYLQRHGADRPAERVALDRPLEPGTHRSAEYDRRVCDLLIRYGFELVHIRHLAWHGLGLPEVCRRLGIPVVLSFHDFYAMCPTVKLLDAEGNFCAGHCTTGKGACVAELWPGDALPLLRNAFVHRWRAMLAEAIEACDAFVTTSPFARRLLEDHFPVLAERGINLIPHGRSFEHMEALAAEPLLEEPLRVLVPGNISAAKGGALIAAMAALDQGRDVEFHILGAVDEALRAPRAGVVLHGPYTRDEFSARVRQIRPHLGAVLSIWPETYCHTLTECWAAGLPVLGTALGAVAERINVEGGGWLISADTGPQEILARLAELKRDLSELRSRCNEVFTWQRGPGRHYDTLAMAASYDCVYRNLLLSRRSFPQEAEPPSRIALVLGRADDREPFRLGLPLANAPARPFVLRPLSPSMPMRADLLGTASVVLLPAGTLAERDLVTVLHRLRPTGLPVVIEADTALAAVLAQPGALREAVLDSRATLLASTARTQALLAAIGLDAAAPVRGLDPAVWLAAVPDVLPAPGLRLLAFPDDPGLPALRPLLEHLAALGVADLSVDMPGKVGQFRAAARAAAILLLASPRSDFDTQAERRLAGLAAGLAILRPVEVGEAPGETPYGEVLLPSDPAAWVRSLAELSVEPARLDALRRRALRQIRSSLRSGAQLLDAALLASLAPAAKAVDRLAERDQATRL